MRDWGPRRAGQPPAMCSRRAPATRDHVAASGEGAVPSIRRAGNRRIRRAGNRLRCERRAGPRDEAVQAGRPRRCRLSPERVHLVGIQGAGDVTRSPSVVRSTPALVLVALPHEPVEAFPDHAVRTHHIGHLHAGEIEPGTPGATSAARSRAPKSRQAPTERTGRNGENRKPTAMATGTGGTCDSRRQPLAGLHPRRRAHPDARTGRSAARRNPLDVPSSGYRHGWADNWSSDATRGPGSGSRSARTRGAGERGRPQIAGLGLDRVDVASRLSRCAG